MHRIAADIDRAANIDRGAAHGLGALVGLAGRLGIEAVTRGGSGLGLGSRASICAACSSGISRAAVEQAGGGASAKARLRA